MTTAPPGLRIVLMGVAGSGKTTVGQALATALGAAFLDGDDLHSAANRERMRRGQPLTDAERWPWLAALHDRLAAAQEMGEHLVVACSALRRSYRDRLAQGLSAVRFVHLRIGRAAAAARLSKRTDHFFPASLLDSQFDTLEPLQAGLVVDAEQPIPTLVAQLCAAFATR